MLQKLINHIFIFYETTGFAKYKVTVDPTSSVLSKDTLPANIFMSVWTMYKLKPLPSLLPSDAFVARKYLEKILLLSFFGTSSTAVACRLRTCDPGTRLASSDTFQFSVDPPHQFADLTNALLPRNAFVSVNKLGPSQS
jgi:hypothetical protein